jgi:peptidoglycan/LPS O-acetylase OafA/YrhL
MEESIAARKAVAKATVMHSTQGRPPLARELRIALAVILSGGLLGFLASAAFPYGWLIAYPIAGLALGALLAVWIVWPWEDPGDWRSRFWQFIPEAPRGRIAELDALRGLAVTMVCGRHVWSSSPVFVWGWSGVDLFFVLSGYLITDIILQNGREPGFLRAFYARRTLRIWPIYYLTLFAVALFAPGLSRSRGWVETGFGYYLTYTQNIFDQRIPGESLYKSWYGPTWSLALEEQFYLLWPMLVLWIPRRGLPLLIAVWIVGACGMRGQGAEPATLHDRGDGLALGGLLAWLLADREHWRGRLGKYRVGFGLVALTALLLLVMLTASRGRKVLEYPPEPLSLVLLLFDLLYFGAIGFCVCSAGHPALAPLRNRWIVGLGVISYGVYLYHAPIIRVVEEFARRFGIGHRLELDLAKLALPVLTAAVSWKLIEQPILALKKRFAYARNARVERAPG